MQRTHRPSLSLTRRELLRVGGLSVAGGFLNPFAAANVRAAGRAAPRATARNVLFVNLEGGMSQVDTLDAKEGPWTPDDFDIRTCANGLRLPHGLFAKLPEVLDRVAVVRSFAAWDAVHGRAQYYLQTGHPLNLALAKEVPAIGAVVCHELAGERKATDSLPAFISMNMAGNQAGLVNNGFLPADFGPLNLSVGDEMPSLAPQRGMEESLARRWERLQALDGTLRGGAAGVDRALADYHSYYRGAWNIMNDPRVPEVFAITAEDEGRYGDSSVGRSLALARNLLRADAGTRFICVSHGGWDHHGDIYLENSRNHPVLIRELDAALVSLIKDLEAAPSPHAAGKTLLDDTLVVCMSEFGRTPGAISPTRQGREHYIHAHAGLLAGGGIARGAILGATDELGGTITDFGWSGGRAIYMEDVACTIYSALGIDWTKTMQNTPSGRPFHYVEPASGTQYMDFGPVEELFG
jgi:uncharacterized protein (DUF1501 family)